MVNLENGVYVPRKRLACHGVGLCDVRPHVIFMTVSYK
jgi:hypothetical protein